MNNLNKNEKQPLSVQAAGGAIIAPVLVFVVSRFGIGHLERIDDPTTKKWTALVFIIAFFVLLILGLAIGFIGFIGGVKSKSLKVSLKSLFGLILTIALGANWVYWLFHW